MSDLSDVSGRAALSICEALLLAINDHGILPEREVVGVLQDAAAAHDNILEADGDTEKHEAVASLIRSIIASGNLVRRT